MNKHQEYLKRINAALALREIPDYDAALIQLNKALNLDFEDENVFFLLGITYDELNQLEKAEILYLTAVQMRIGFSVVVL